MFPKINLREIESSFCIYHSIQTVLCMPHPLWPLSLPWEDKEEKDKQQLCLFDISSDHEAFVNLGNIFLY